MYDPERMTVTHEVMLRRWREEAFVQCLPILWLSPFQILRPYEK